MRPTKEELQAIRQFVPVSTNKGELQTLLAEIDALTQDRDHFRERMLAAANRELNLAEELEQLKRRSFAENLANYRGKK